MRTRSFLAVAVLSACIPHRGTAPPPPEQFGYARELGEVLEAVDDLERSESGYFDAKAAAKQLDTAFEKVCQNYQVSCDHGAWQHPWKNRGEVGLHLAHALSAIDRAYAVWSRDRDMRLQDAVQAVDDARRTVRELIFTREHVGVAHLPAHRNLMIASEELAYAHALIGDAPPPAKVPWDAITTRAVIDDSRAALDGHWPDGVATAHYSPDPADFANISYIGHLLVAKDLLDRAFADIHADEAWPLEPGRGPLTEIVRSLPDAASTLSATEAFGSGPLNMSVGAAPGDAFSEEIRTLALARRAIAIVHTSDPEIVRRHAIAEQAIKDAFVAACGAEHVPADEDHWLPNAEEVHVSPTSLSAVDAEFSLAPDGRFSEARRHLAPAFAVLYQLQAIRNQWSQSGQAFYGLYDQLVLARNMLDVVPPADHPWDARPAVANMNAAIAAIDDAKLARPSGGRYNFRAVPPNYDYKLRLVIAHEGIARALAEAERFPGTGPRTALVKAHAVVEALGVALGKPTVTAQRSAAPKR